MYFTEASLYWLEVLLEERFGPTFKLRQAGSELTLSLRGAPEVIVFDTLQPSFHQSFPGFSCRHWCASSEGFAGPIEDLIPAPCDDELHIPLVDRNERGFTIHYDILGLTYWMLTRLEEIGCVELDNHQRFPAASSHAFKHGYLERPIVDEWLHILGQVIRRIWPQLSLKEHFSEIRVSHDVDVSAKYAFGDLKDLARTIGGEVVVKKNFGSVFWGPWIRLNSRKEIHSRDPSNTFDWLMDQSELHGIKSAFYFICGRTDATKDALYDPEMPQIRALIRKIHSRGHEIGLHPSYNTFNQPSEISKEMERLKRVCREEGVHQTRWGGRMHFLRWDQAVTPRALSGAGMSYDTTLGFADRPGFRCGTCYEYPAFDAAGDCVLPMRIRPLVVMECTVMANRYLGLGSTEDAFDRMSDLKRKCHAVDGTFTLLWHNSAFHGDKDFDIYSRLLGSI